MAFIWDERKHCIKPDNYLIRRQIYHAVFWIAVLFCMALVYGLTR